MELLIFLQFPFMKIIRRSRTLYSFLFLIAFGRLHVTDRPKYWTAARANE